MLLLTKHPKKLIDTKTNTILINFKGNPEPTTILKELEIYKNKVIIVQDITWFQYLKNNKFNVKK